MTNTNVRGGSPARRRSRERMIVRYAADVDLVTIGEWRELMEEMWRDPGLTIDAPIEVWVPGAIGVPLGWIAVRRGVGRPACRCYRCGELLVFGTATRDRINPGAKGGAYVDANIRPACSSCQTITGNELKAQLRALALAKLNARRAAERRQREARGASAPSFVVGEMIVP